MKSKRIKKSVSAACAAILGMTLLSGCGVSNSAGNVQDSGNADGGSQRTKPVEITFAIFQLTNISL